MDVLLIPGFWLDASSWDAVSPVIERAGHGVRALTLPGLESFEADRTGIGLREHTDAVIAAVDATDGPVVLVGHSGGGPIAQAVADARPERVARVVYVDAGPLVEGQAINDELPIVDGEIPLPDWSAFSDEELADLDDRLRAEFRARAIPEPADVATDPQRLADERRLAVPATIICTSMTSAQIRGWIAQDHPLAAELVALHDVEYVDLPTGHWPQFTRPAELGALIVAAIDRS